MRTNKVMFVFLPFLALFCYSVPNVVAAQSGWRSLFGRQTLEECVLENMRGVASDAAAKAIRFACEERIRRAGPPQIIDLTDRITVNLDSDQASNRRDISETSTSFTIFFSTPNVTIHSITLMLFLNRDTVERTFECLTTTPVQPFRVGRVRCPFNIHTLADQESQFSPGSQVGFRVTRVLGMRMD